MNDIERVHQRAVGAAKDLKRSERELLDALIEVDKKSVFKKKGYSTLHDYCVMELQLTDAQAYTYIGVARKAKEVPELRTMVSEGAIQISNARKIVPELNTQNKIELLSMAKDLTFRQLERELVKKFPEKVTKERIRPVTETRLELKVFITPELERKLKRLQDVLSQKLKKPCSLEAALEVIVEETLEWHDPIRKAQRARQPLVARQTGIAKVIPAQVAHEVAKRDQGRCTFILPNGQRCPSQRWLHRHHIVPRSKGGAHSSENLTLLCSTHHQFIHDSGLSRAKLNPFRAGPVAR